MKIPFISDDDMNHDSKRMLVESARCSLVVAKRYLKHSFDMHESDIIKNAHHYPSKTLME